MDGRFLDKPPINEPLCSGDEGPLMIDYVEIRIMCTKRPLDPCGRYHTLRGMRMRLLAR